MLVAAFICGGTVFTSAREYVYLSEDGNDENNGASFAQAYATFSKALEMVSNGGTIYVRGMVNIYEDPENVGDTVQHSSGDTKRGFVPTKSLTIRGESKETCGFTGYTDSILAYEPFPGYPIYEYYQMGTRFLRVNPGIELTLKDLTFTKFYGRHCGIVILMAGGKLIAEDLIFSENEAISGSDNGMGAAIHSNATTGISVSRCLFYKNKAMKGGAVYIADSQNQNVDITFESCSFIENAQNVNENPTAGAIFLRLTAPEPTPTDPTGGRPIETHSLNNTLNLINCTFAKNTTMAIGGAVHLYGVPPSTTFSAINCTFTENTSEGGDSRRGAGLVIGAGIGQVIGGERCKIWIQNSIFENNRNTIIQASTTRYHEDIVFTNMSSTDASTIQNTMKISNSYVGNTYVITGNIPNGCWDNCTRTYATSGNTLYNNSGLDAFDAENNVYPLKAGAATLAYGKTEFLDNIGVFWDAIGRERPESESCSAGAMEGAGTGGDICTWCFSTWPPIPPELPLGISLAPSNNIRIYQENNQLLVNAANSLELFGINGQSIAKKTGNKETLAIPLGNLKGIYVARVLTDGQIYSQKVIIK